MRKEAQEDEERHHRVARVVTDLLLRELDHHHQLALGGEEARAQHCGRRGLVQ